MIKRRSFTPEFKAEVVLELLQEEKELNQLATEHEIAPNMLRNWKKELVTRTGSNLSVSAQCKLLDLNRTSIYYKEQAATDLEIDIKYHIDYLHTQHPAWGTRRIKATLVAKGYSVGRKLVRRYME